MKRNVQSKQSSHPSQPRGEATRADIIGVAKRLFSEHGYFNTVLSDIQAATALSKGAFYHHFRSKEELAMAVLESAQCDYAEQLIEPSMVHDSPGAQLAALLDRVLELNAQPHWPNCQMIATLCAELATAEGRLREAIHGFQMGRLERLADLIQRGQASGEINSKLDPQVWAHWITCTLIGMILSKKLGAESASPADLVAQIKLGLFSSSGFATMANRS